MDESLSAEAGSNSAGRHGLVQIVVASTTIFLAAGRFGLTPSANRLASPGLKLQGNDSGLKTGDPAGFTATDVLYLGTIGAGPILRTVAASKHQLHSHSCLIEAVRLRGLALPMRHVGARMTCASLHGF